MPKFSSILFASLLAPTFAIAAVCTPVGSWTQSSGGVVNISANLIGTIKLPYCAAPHTLGTTLNGISGFLVIATYTGASDCQGFRETLTFNAACTAVAGTYVNDDGSSGLDSWVRNDPTIALSRTGLTDIRATGTPLGGVFSYTTTAVTGLNHAIVAQPQGNTNNPNDATVTPPAGGGAPRPGGLVNLTAKYTVGTSVAVNSSNSIATFGMSCYMVALESDYGAAPNSCLATRIRGAPITGAVVNPNGLTGTYCASFIENVKLQGTGQLNDATYINYNVSRGVMIPVTSVNGADNTPVVAGATVARDRTIIPGRGVLVDLSAVGSGLLANDTGGAIRGYRLDLFNGAGRAACAGYSNPVTIGVCRTPQGTTCPGSTLQ